MSRLKIIENIHIKFIQILGVTADNALNNDKMIERLAESINNFPGTANQTRCFTHILNLVAKSVLHQFEAPKAKRVDSINDAMKGLAAVSDELEDEGDDVVVDEEADEDGDNEGDNDDDDGLPEEREGMSQEQLAELEASVQPI
jgi:hypothetical protein